MSKKSQVKNSITQIDQFGHNIQLLYQKKPKHITFFGGLTTILNGILLVIVAYSYGAELVYKQNPITNFSEESIRQPEQYNMTPSVFNMAFGMQNPATFDQFIDESIYSISVIRNQMTKVYNQTTRQYDQIWNSIDLGPHPCDLSNFQVKDSFSYFQQLAGIDQMYCFNQTDNQASISGDFEADFFQSIEFFIYQCQNKTEEEAADLIKKGQRVIICKSQDEIDKILMNGYFAAYYTDKLINPKLIDQPFTTFPRDIFWPTSNKLMKELTMYWRNVYIESDVGIVSQKKMIQRDVTFSYSTEQVTLGQSNQFIHLIIRFEKAKQSRYFRQYIKIQDVLAQVSGVMNLFFLISSLICKKISELDQVQCFFNDIFSFQSIENEIQEKNKLKQIEKCQKKQKTVQNFQEQKYIIHQKKSLNNCQQNTKNKVQSTSSVETNNLNETQKDNQDYNSSTKNKQVSQTFSNIIKKFNEQDQITSNDKKENEQEKVVLNFVKKTTRTLQLYYYEYLLYYLFPCSKRVSRKKKQIEFSKQVLYKHLDIMYLISKLQEIDKLKMLLLSEQQIKLFNYLPKLTIKESQIIQSQQQASQQISSANKQNCQNQLEYENIASNQSDLTEKFNKLYFDERSEIEKISDAYQAFNQLKKHKRRTETDIKLLKMLDPNILCYFLDQKEMKHFFSRLNYQSKESEYEKQSNKSLDQNYLDFQIVNSRQIRQNNEDCEQNNKNQSNQDSFNLDTQNISIYQINMLQKQDSEQQSNNNLIKFENSQLIKNKIYSNKYVKQKPIFSTYNSINSLKSRKFEKKSPLTFKIKASRDNCNCDKQTISIKQDAETISENIISQECFYSFRQKSCTQIKTESQQPNEKIKSASAKQNYQNAQIEVEANSDQNIPYERESSQKNNSIVLFSQEKRFNQHCIKNQILK
ncbi:hypothetical protein ABPG74_004666 [Tetrahymena malaccensis]